jgi:hypothetical protein
MMVYGGVPLKYVWGTLVITLRKNHIDRHFEDTDMSDTVPLGRKSTLIRCTLEGKGKDGKRILRQIAHSEAAADLRIGDEYYKNVTTGEASDIRPVSKGVWQMDIEFRAGDPIPYSVETDEKLWH